MNKIKLTILLITTAVLLTACQDKEAGKLDNRVLAFWNFKISKDFKSAYQFLSPGWKINEKESVYTLRMGMSKVKWIDAKIKDKECKQTDLCIVRMTIDYEYQFKGVTSEKMVVSTTLSENWIMKDNVWYNLPIDKKL